MADSQSAFNALLALAQRSRQSAAGLPAQTKVQPTWSGIGFTLMGQYFVAPMGEVAELLEMPTYTHLPSVQPWVLGVANVRGRLLPIFDLAQYFGGNLVGQRKKHRILILEHEEFYSGLCVDTAMGMQHFPIDTYSSDISEVNELLQPFLNGSYSQSRSATVADEQKWYVFSPARLLADPRFINAAAS